MVLNQAARNRISVEKAMLGREARNFQLNKIDNLHLPVPWRGDPELFSFLLGLPVRFEKFETLLNVGRSDCYVLHLLGRFDNIFGHLPVHKHLFQIKLLFIYIRRGLEIGISWYYIKKSE